MNDQIRETETVELHIQPGGNGTPLVLSHAPADLHKDAKRIHQLLDVLNLPKGTEVRIITKASTMIVR